MAFPYCVTQMYIDNTHAHTRLEMWGHYKQLFISLPFKSICLRSAAKGTNSNCFPLNTLDRRVRLGSDNDFPRCSPSLLLVLPPSSHHFPRPSHLHSSASVSQMGILTCTHLIEAGQTASFLPLPSVSLLSQGQNAKSEGCCLCPPQHSLSFTTLHARTLWPHISGLWGPRTLDTSFSLWENCIHSISMFRLCTLYCYKG